MSIKRSIKIGQLKPMSLERAAEIARGKLTPEHLECLWELARVHHRLVNARHALDFAGESHTYSKAIVSQTIEKLDQEPCVIAARAETTELLKGPDGRPPGRPTSDRH